MYEIIQFDQIHIKIQIYLLYDDDDEVDDEKVDDDEVDDLQNIIIINYSHENIVYEYDNDDNDEIELHHEWLDYHDEIHILMILQHIDDEVEVDQIYNERIDQVDDDDDKIMIVILIDDHE